MSDTDETETPSVSHGREVYNRLQARTEKELPSTNAGRDAYLARRGTKQS